MDRMGINGEDIVTTERDIEEYHEDETDYEDFHSTKVNGFTPKPNLFDHTFHEAKNYSEHTKEEAFHQELRETTFEHGFRQEANGGTDFVPDVNSESDFSPEANTETNGETKFHPETNGEADFQAHKIPTNNDSYSALEDWQENDAQTDEEQDKTCGHCKQTFPTYLELFRHTCSDENRKKARKYSKTIRTCQHCQEQFKSLIKYRKHVLDCWRKRAPKKKMEIPIAIDYEIKAEPLDTDSDDTIVLHDDDKVLDQFQNEVHVKDNQVNEDYDFMEDFIPEPKIIIKQEYVEPNQPARRRSKPKSKKLPIPETHCNICGVRYKNLKHYNVHRRRKIPCSPPPYICKSCGTQFMTTYNLFYHETKGNCSAAKGLTPVKKRKPSVPKQKAAPPVPVDTSVNDDSLFDFLKQDYQEEESKLDGHENQTDEATVKPRDEVTVMVKPRDEATVKIKPRGIVTVKLRGDTTKKPRAVPKIKPREELKEKASEQPNEKAREQFKGELKEGLEKKSTDNPKILPNGVKLTPKPRVTTKILSCGLCDSKFLFAHLRKRHYEKYHKGVSPIDTDDGDFKPVKKARRIPRNLMKTKTPPKEKQQLQEPLSSRHSEELATNEGQIIFRTKSPIRNKSPITTKSPFRAQSPPICQKKKNSYDTTMDVSIYLTPKGYECPLCEQHFKFPCRLREHLCRKVPCRPFSKFELPDEAEAIPKPELVSRVMTKKLKRPYETDDNPDEDVCTPKKKTVECVTPKPIAKKVPIDKKSGTVIDDKKNVKVLPPKIKEKIQVSNMKLKVNKVSKALCKLCNKVFPSFAACYEHRLKYHDSNVKHHSENVHNKIAGGLSRLTVHIAPVRKLTSPKPCEPSEKRESMTLEKIKLTIKKEDLQSGFETLVECPICLKKFVLIKARNSHIKSAHNAFPKEKIMKFLKDTYCKKCKKFFGTPKDKCKHVAEVHGIIPDEPEPIFATFRSPKNNCPYCNGEFPSKTHLNTHMIRCDMKKVKISPRSLKVMDPSNGLETSPGDNGYYCSHCEIKFNSLTLYKAHANRFCPKRDQMKTNKSKDFKQELFGLDDKVSLTCEMCATQFTKRLEYDIHIKELCTSRPLLSKQALGSSRLITKQVEKPKPSSEEDKSQSEEVKIALKYSPKFIRVSTCKTCHKSFPTVLHYASHKRRCKDVLDPNSASSANPSKYKKNPAKLSTSLIKNKKKFGHIKPAKFNPRKSVKCTVCFKVFSEVFTLSRHVRLVHLPQNERNTFRCMFCNLKFMGPRQLTKHYTNSHPESLKFLCSKCGKRYATNTRCLQHITKTHRSANEEIKVRDLDDEVPDVTVNQPHDEEPVLTREEIDQIQSPVSPKIRSPIKTPSPKSDKITSEDDDNFYTILDDTPGRGLYCCDVCNVSTFTKINALRRHWKTKPHKENVERHRAELKSKAAEAEKLTLMDGNYSDQKLSCSVCLKSFFNITAFVRHRLRHFNAQKLDLAEINIFNPYVCEICQKVFSHHQRVQSHLLWHMKTKKILHPATKIVLVKLPEAEERQYAGIPKIVHKVENLDQVSAKKTIGGRVSAKLAKQLDQNQYTCDQCFEKFGSKYLYGAHVRHSCPKRLNCPYCSVLFANKKVMLEHMEKCPDKGDLTCRFCYLKLDSISDLGWHEKGCVKVNDSQDVALNDDHILQCFWCKFDIGTIEGDYVQEHMYTHPKNEIKMTCRLCDVWFNNKTDIYEHMNELSHLGSIPNGTGNNHSWNTLDPTEKNEDLSPADTDHLDSDTVRCGSKVEKIEHYLLKKDSKYCHDSIIYSPWINDDKKRLRTNFAQLMYLLISDIDLLSSLGWGSRAIDGVLKDILVYLGQMPQESFLINKESQEMEILRSNIQLFLKICVKDDLLEADGNETVDDLVSRMLEICTSKKLE